MANAVSVAFTCSMRAVRSGAGAEEVGGGEAAALAPSRREAKAKASFFAACGVFMEEILRSRVDFFGRVYRVRPQDNLS